MSAVTVYTKPNCSKCVQTKDLMNELGIEFSESDISKDAEARKNLKGLGFKEAPVIVTDTESWSGFNESKIRALLSNDSSDDSTWDF